MDISSSLVVVVGQRDLTEDGFVLFAGGFFCRLVSHLVSCCSDVCLDPVYDYVSASPQCFFDVPPCIEQFGIGFL